MLRTLDFILLAVGNHQMILSRGKKTQFALKNVSLVAGWKMNFE